MSSPVLRGRSSEKEWSQKHHTGDKGLSKCSSSLLWVEIGWRCRLKEELFIRHTCSISQCCWFSSPVKLQSINQQTQVSFPKHPSIPAHGPLRGYSIYLSSVATKYPTYAKDSPRQLHFWSQMATVRHSLEGGGSPWFSDVTSHNISPSVITTAWRIKWRGTEFWERGHRYTQLFPLLEEVCHSWLNPWSSYLSHKSHYLFTIVQITSRRDFLSANHGQEWR